MVNLKIICFEGKAKTGKSTTIKKILEDYFKFNIIKPAIRKDFCLIFSYNGKIIGICNVGDTIALLKKYLTQLKDCDLIICASHPRKKAKEFLGKLSKNIEFIECSKPKVTDEENWKNEHLDRIEKFKKILE